MTKAAEWIAKGTSVFENDECIGLCGCGKSSLVETRRAKLMAAAPDMLAALMSWIEEVDGTYPFESLAATRAAIAKATAS